METRIAWWEAFLASFIGGTFLCLADILFNETPVTTRIAVFLGERLGSGFDSTAFEGVAFLVLILLGAGLCFVHQPRTRPAAFVRGSSVIGVLFGMNIGSSFVAAAAGEPLLLDQSAQISMTQPRAFGPLGIGTVLTGRSLAATQTVELGGQTTVPCSNSLTIGGDTYCATPFGAISCSIVNDASLGAVAADQEVWILRP